MDADSHSWGAYLVVVCRAVAQREVTVGKNSVCGNTLLEMPFEFRQVSQSQTISKSRINCEEAFCEFPGSASKTIYTSASMDSQAAKQTKTKIVVESVKGNDFSFVAKPIRKAPATYLQGLSVQNDFDVKQGSAFVNPFGVRPLEFCVLKAKLFLFLQPLLCFGKFIEPRTILVVLIKIPQLIGFSVSQLDCCA